VNYKNYLRYSQVYICIYCPGTGKTSVATKIALVLRSLGYLSKGHVSNVTREDLVGQYVGHTAKTKEQLQRAQGGILFIDEAHHL
jgi:SpoVK/Ycf46/Vps4 family AAA+-type ATPase